MSTKAPTAKRGSFPSTTKSIVLTGFGGYDKLKIKALPSPSAPGPDQVLVHVRAVGINFADILLRQGIYDPLPTLPEVMGLEGSGDIISVGHAVNDLKTGNRVLFLKRIGTWSEYVVVGAVQCFHMPDNMSYEEGAALPVNYITAHNILFGFGGLSKNQNVLVHMAAGGVGMAATQLCKTIPNVTVFGTASAAKHDLIQKNGVDHPIDYRNQDYVEEIRKIDPQGVASAVSGTSRNYWTLLKTVVGFKSYGFRDLMKNNKAACGYHLERLLDHHEVVRPTVESLLIMYKEGKIKPHIDSVWAFEDVGLAMAKIQDRLNVGKIILSPQKEPQHKQ